jgi:outer membrane lipoprotein-sorting protein
MWKKILPMGLVLVVVFSFAACVGEASAQEIVNGTFESVDDITSYQFDVDMTMDVAGEAEGEAFEMNMMMGCNGVLDLENRQMTANITMSMVVPGEDELEVEMEIYLLDDMVYMMTEVSVIGPMWMKSEISEGDWAEMSEGMRLTESQLELLESAEVKVLASETIKGIDCYVLQLTPDMEQLWQTVMQQAQVTGEEILPEVDETFLEEVFRNFSVKQWFAKDTYFLTKAEMDMTMELTPEAMGYPEEEGEMSMDITMILFAYDYNKPVSIVLPVGAREATEVPME